jgi:hypothetical protein
MINNQKVTAPDEERWIPHVTGVNLYGLQERGPYWTLQWRKNVDSCRVLDDWFQHDNTVLNSLITRPPDAIDEWYMYTDVVCQSVTHRFIHGNVVEVVMTFEVCVG